jgi:NAD(P)-dependent dehydrogenase (short-subunit alcohol dehydrogenase family)
MGIPEQKFTNDGYEMQFQTNHLGPFLLFQLLRDSLLASSTEEFPSRVVNLSSAGHGYSGIRFDNFNLQNKYAPFVAYGQSKTANIYMTNTIERRYGSKGLHGLSLHPGAVLTDLWMHRTKDQVDAIMQSAELMKKFKNTEQGAATTILAAIGKDYHGKGGVYLEDCGDWGMNPASEPTRGLRGAFAHAFDPEKEDRLWLESSKIVAVEE